MIELNPNLRNVPQEIRDFFKRDSFICPDCGGQLLPYSMTMGACVQCSIEAALDDAEYEVDEDD